MNISRGKLCKAKKIVLYGVEGIGKSTFASHFPEPVFIDVEDSTVEMDVSRFDKPSSFPMLLQQVQYVAQNPSVCKTLVLDTLDWAEKFAYETVCMQKGWKSIEDGGYGSGYRFAYETMGSLLNELTNVVNSGVNVLLIAHAAIQKFEQPDELGAYDRWELKLQTSKKCNTAAMVKEWADMVLFANYKTTVVNVDGQGAVKGKNKVQGGKRVMYTSHNPCWDAKNRFGLPEEMPFDFAQLVQSIPDLGGAVQAPTIEQYTLSQQIASPQPYTQSAPLPQSPQVVPQQIQPQIMQSSESIPPQVFIPNSAIQMQQPSEPPQKSVPRHLESLYELMKMKGFTAEDVQKVVGERGYFPADMPLEEYPVDFVEGVLIGAWEQVSNMISQHYGLPF